jgi:hypothetical protein
VLPRGGGEGVKVAWSMGKGALVGNQDPAATATGTWLWAGPMGEGSGPDPAK